MSPAFRWLLSVFGWFAVLCAGCSDADGVRVGVKPFTEHEVLAEIIVGVLEDREIPVRPPYRCADTFDCERALQSGYVDVMVEYTGTALHLMGAPPPADDVTPREWLNELYGPMGAQWMEPLGFDNGYVWLMPAPQAAATSTQTLSDLERREAPLRVACPPEYLRRPRDGLIAVAERYGLNLDPEPLIIPDALQRYQATLAGRADVAVGYATDGNLTELGFEVLRDDLGFFTDYEAAIVVRDSALAAHPDLADALGSLEGRIDTDTIRSLNRAAGIGGEPIDSVARGFLRDADLLQEAPPGERRVALRVVYSSESTRRAFGTQALGAVRQVFADRTVAMSLDDDPLRVIGGGEARLGVVGAEAFFREDRKGRLKRDQGVEAVAVLGRRVLHVVTRPGADSSVLAGKVGIPEDGDDARLAETMLRFSDNEAAQRSSVTALLEEVRAGRLDAALIAAQRGDPEITDALKSGLGLASMDRWLDAERQLQFPFMRPVRLRPGTYPGQDQSVDTLSSQVLLVAASSREGPANVGGPAAAVPAGGNPLTKDERQALASAVGTAEAPDPAVPSAWSLGARRAADTPKSRWIDRTLNALVIIFLAWLAFIVVDPRAGPAEDDQSADQANPAE